MRATLFDVALLCARFELCGERYVPRCCRYARGWRRRWQIAMAERRHGAPLMPLKRERYTPTGECRER